MDGGTEDTNKMINNNTYMYTNPINTPKKTLPSLHSAVTCREAPLERDSLAIAIVYE